MHGTARSSSAIAADLRALGLGEGALVMVHASLRSVGPVDGGADGLINAIGEAIGGSGTMLMVLGAHDDHAWVNQKPEAERPALLDSAQPFEAQVTPAAADVGALAEVFRQRSETRVSDHPEGRFAAAGPLAEELLADVPWDDYFGPDSPLARLINGEGRILRLGADMNTVTALHYAEYLCVISPKRRVRRHRLVVGRTGPEVRVVECLDDEEGIVDYDGDDYFADILRDYLASGAARSGLVGDAQSELLSAAAIVTFGARWMDEHLASVAEAIPLDVLLSRLDADLSEARRRRSRPEVSAVGSLKSALANAQAVPVGDGPFRLVEGNADAPRRVLSAADIRTVVVAELDERRRAIIEYRTAGVDTQALELELATIERYFALT